ncbi:MAG: GNAT family N-acetyltransferase [Emcibacteraceae bacterium]|nr:GNAT family N-acetyltransferase [Emcibacteraceae bacterium]
MSYFKIKDYSLKCTLAGKTVFDKIFHLKRYYGHTSFHTIDDLRLKKPEDFFDQELVDGLFPPSIPMKNSVKKIINENGFLKYLISTYTELYVDFSSGFESYLAAFSSKSRSTLKRKIRKFEKLSNGEIDWKMYKDPDEIMEFYHLARSVSKETYQEKEFNIGLPDTPEFIELIKKQAMNNSVRGYLLFLEGKPISYLYYPLNNKIFSYSHLGYLPEMGKYSVGTVLFVLSLEQIFTDEDADYMHFFEGESPVKDLFSTGSEKCGNYVVLKSTFKNKLWIYLHYSLQSSFDIFTNFLDKVGIKEKLKKFFLKNP